MSESSLVSTLDALEKVNALYHVPDIISSNINQNFDLRPYQYSAFKRLVTYFENENIKEDNSHILFHMATGSGKTLIMAGSMLYLYSKGYRNFIFFVNSTNIIKKTKKNFLDKNSSKYLFSDNININGENITIKEINDYQFTDENSINICFTTIQGLHDRLNSPSENSITYNDFANKKTVLISDESHHINSKTKSKKNTKTQDNLNSWEDTVERLLLINKDNVLLEFSATMDIFNNKEVKAKYKNKTIFDYDLKKFRLNGYSKEVRILQSQLDIFDRALLATIVSQYRLKIFEKHKISAKPIVLMKSKKIDESINFQKLFHKKLNSLTSEYVQNLINNLVVESDGEFLITQIKNYLSKENIDIENFLLEIKNDFCEDYAINVNNNTELIEKQDILNSLEDSNNKYRIIFAVNKLDEGWDVLNLFDIVRLYDSRVVAKEGKISPPTMAEAQLIGRGARYFPFMLDDKDKYKRKFDDDIHNEMRICEELYYHSKDDSRYISELKSAFDEIGLTDTPPQKEIHLKVKEEFKNSETYNKGVIYVNTRDEIGLSNNKIDDTLKESIYTVTLPTNKVGIEDVFGSNTETREDKVHSFNINLKDIEHVILKKALRGMNVFAFNNLKKMYPSLASIDDFINNSLFLGDIKVQVNSNVNNMNALTKKQKLYIAKQVTDVIGNKIKNPLKRYKGTSNFIPINISSIVKDKVLNITLEGTDGKGHSQNNSSNDKLRLDLSSKEWYAHTDNFGTTEEKSFVKYFNSMYDQLKESYTEVILIRNENFCKIYSFAEGKPLQPDYILLLKQKQSSKIDSYQVFIEMKGKHLLDKDKWKEDFLLNLNEDIESTVLYECEKIKIWGLPFYNSTTVHGTASVNFDTKFKDLF